MPLKNDFINSSLLDAIEAQREILDSLYAPAQVIAKYFFHQILAPLIVQLLLLLISGSFKDE